MSSKLPVIGGIVVSACLRFGKRGINGTFHVSRGHLSRYCDEFAFRYENRKTSDGDRSGLIVKGAEGKRLIYKQPEGISKASQERWNLEWGPQQRKFW